MGGDRRRAAHVAYATAEAGARLVHVSSDAVHAGRPEPYADDEIRCPVHVADLAAVVLDLVDSRYAGAR
ncbi:hypothetical protein ABT346_11960 [Micromonospora peucetia]|uniref:hypothetical protein n=1 Tax=Micromonospora peucetia TaxID=47871 RepID=UPI003322E1DA